VKTIERMADICASWWRLASAKMLAAYRRESRRGCLPSIGRRRLAARIGVMACGGARGGISMARENVYQREKRRGSLQPADGGAMAQKMR